MHDKADDKLAMIEEVLAAKDVTAHGNGESTVLNAVSQSGHIEVTADSSEEEAEDAAQKDVLVWYASYGSNLSGERFNCYLCGGRVAGMSRDCIGARDGTMARESI